MYIRIAPHLDDRRLQHLHCENSNNCYKTCHKKPVNLQIHYKLHRNNVLEDSLYHGEHSTEQLHLCSEGVERELIVLHTDGFVSL